MKLHIKAPLLKCCSSKWRSFSPSSRICSSITLFLHPRLFPFLAFNDMRAKLRCWRSLKSLTSLLVRSQGCNRISDLNFASSAHAFASSPVSGMTESRRRTTWRSPRNVHKVPFAFTTVPMQRGTADENKFEMPGLGVWMIKLGTSVGSIPWRLSFATSVAAAIEEFRVILRSTAAPLPSSRPRIIRFEPNSVMEITGPTSRTNRIGWLRKKYMSCAVQRLASERV